MMGPSSEEDIMEAIFYYLDHIMWILRPRKLIYLAGKYAREKGICEIQGEISIIRRGDT